ncbi:hypothetical protein BC828DRAFT_392288 [Blastocladiella britannica]|nr:hypothetical protein BC828DRAFT_392288 [Blastocladiella britannica]
MVLAPNSSVPVLALGRQQQKQQKQHQKQLKQQPTSTRAIPPSPSSTRRTTNPATEDPDTPFESGAWLFDGSRVPAWMASQLPVVQVVPVVPRIQRQQPNTMTWAEVAASPVQSRQASPVLARRNISKSPTTSTAASAARSVPRAITPVPTSTTKKIPSSYDNNSNDDIEGPVVHCAYPSPSRQVSTALAHYDAVLLRSSATRADRTRLETARAQRTLRSLQHVAVALALAVVAIGILSAVHVAITGRNVPGKGTYVGEVGLVPKVVALPRCPAVPSSSN